MYTVLRLPVKFWTCVCGSSWICVLLSLQHHFNFRKNTTSHRHIASERGREGERDRLFASDQLLSMYCLFITHIFLRYVHKCSTDTLWWYHYRCYEMTAKPSESITRKLNRFISINFARRNTEITNAHTTHTHTLNWIGRIDQSIG